MFCPMYVCVGVHVCGHVCAVVFVCESVHTYWRCSVVLCYLSLSADVCYGMYFCVVAHVLLHV